jgi:hypothetical protein
MIKHNIITYQIETMQPSWLVDEAQRRVYRLYIGLFGGMLLGLLAGPLFGQLFGLLFGLLAGLLAGLFGVGFIGTLWTDRIIMVDRLKWSWREAWRGLILMQFGTWLIVLVDWLFDRFSGGRFGELLSRPLIAPFMGLTIGLFFGLTSKQIEETTYPGQRLKQTLSNTLFSTFIIMLIFVLILGPVGRLLYGTPLIELLFGLPILGLFVALLIELFGEVASAVSASPKGFLAIVQHYLLRWMLARHHRFPRRLIAFLEYTVSLIFLRRVGGSYIFVHRSLMEHFAEMEEIQR